MSNTQTPFTFTFFRFIPKDNIRTTEVVRDYHSADGMKGLVTRDQVREASKRASEWASSVGITLRASEPYPSGKYPGKVWLQFRFGGLTL